MHIFFNKSIVIIVSLQIDKKLKSCYTNVAIKKRKGEIKTKHYYCAYVYGYERWIGWTCTDRYEEIEDVIAIAREEYNGA